MDDEKTLDEIIEEEAQEIADSINDDYLKEVERLKGLKKNSEESK